MIDRNDPERLRMEISVKRSIDYYLENQRPWRRGGYMLAASTLTSVGLIIGIAICVMEPRAGIFAGVAAFMAGLSGFVFGTQERSDMIDHQLCMVRRYRESLDTIMDCGHRLACRGAGGECEACASSDQGYLEAVADYGIRTQH